MLGVTVSDPMSGFFALRKTVLEGIQFKSVKWKVLFEILSKKGELLTISEVPYVFQKRLCGLSKTSRARLATIVLNVNADFLILSIATYMIMTTTMASRLYYARAQIKIQEGRLQLAIRRSLPSVSC